MACPVGAGGPLIFIAMLLTLLLDPHWLHFEEAVAWVFLGCALPLVLGLLLRGMERPEERPEGAESRAWSTRRAVTVTLAAFSLMLLVAYCR